MIIIFTYKESAVDRALKQVVDLILPDIGSDISAWSEETDDYQSLQKSLLAGKQVSLIVNTAACSAKQIGQLFTANMRPAPSSLFVFGHEASEVVQLPKVKEWVNGKAAGEPVLLLTSVLSSLPKPFKGLPNMNHFLSDCHSLKSTLLDVLRDNRQPLVVRCREILGQLNDFITVRVNLDGDDVIIRFFRAFRDYLKAVSEGKITGEDNLVYSTVQHYCNVMGSGSIEEMSKLLGGAREAKTFGHSPDNQASNSVANQSIKKIPVTVLVVEDNHEFAQRLIESYKLYHPPSDKFEITFILHVPERDDDGVVVETQQGFRERLMTRVMCESTLWPDEQLTRLQSVIMDYAMDDFASDMTAERVRLSGVELAKDIRGVRPGVDIFLLTGKDILQVVEEGDGVFNRPFWKHDQLNGEIDEMFYALHEGLERKYRAPFWNALRDFTRRPVMTFHAMALARGKSAKKSNVLEDFVQFYSNNYFMAETSATIEPLDSLLHPVGSILEAQNRAAYAFGAKRTLFVTNGTSTANKIVLQAVLQPSDPILVDRNCHISHHYGISLAQARPYYLEPYQLNQYGISGGIPLNTLSQSLQNLIDETGDIPKAILLTNCTFDGIICQPRKIIETVRNTLNQNNMGERLKEIVFLFDEAWFAYARFHPRFVNFTGMASAQALCEEDEFYRRNLRVYVTQSTHKTLSAFRQASMIHIWDPVLELSDEARLRLEEAFLTHTSTSPHSGIIASLDVARRQAELEGCALVADALVYTNVFRDDFKRAREGVAAANWNRVGMYFDVLTDADLIPEAYRNEFILDPAKITLQIKQGYSGAELKRRLLTNFNIQINKHSDNTVLLMVNAGATMSAMAALKQVLIEMSKEIEHQEMRIGATLRGAPNREGELVVPSFSQFLNADANGHNPGQQHDIAFFFNNEAGWRIEWIPIGEGLIGRASATFISPYPPGYPILVPGQVIDASVVSFLMSLSTKEIHGTQSDIRGQRRIGVFILP